MDTFIQKINLLFERYWLFFLITAGMASVNQEAGIALLIYAYASLKLIHCVLTKNLPKPSLEQVVLIGGCMIITTLQHFQIGSELLNYKLFNWLLLLTIPFYLIQKNCVNKKTLQLFNYLILTLLLIEPHSELIPQHLWLANPNVLALLILFIGLNIHHEHPLKWLLHQIVILSILFMLDYTGGLILYTSIRVFLSLKQPFLRKTYVATYCLAIVAFISSVDLSEWVQGNPNLRDRSNSYSFFSNYFINSKQRLWGHGFSSTEIIADNAETEFKYPFTDIRRFNNVHNEVLQNLIEGGVFWTIALFISFFYFFYRNIKESRLRTELIIFLIIFIVTIQFYSVYRNGIIYALLPFIGVAYGLRFSTSINTEWLKKAIFVFYFIAIPIFGIQTALKFKAFENLRKVNLKTLNQSIHLDSGEPLFYYEKLRYLVQSRHFPEDAFTETKAQLDLIHPNYKEVQFLEAQYAFKKGEIKRAYTVAKSECQKRKFNLMVEAYPIFYAAHLDKDILRNELINLFRKAIIIENTRKNLDLQLSIDAENLIIVGKDRKVAVNIQKTKEALQKNKAYGLEKMAKWLFHDLVKKTFNREGLNTGNGFFFI